MYTARASPGGTCESKITMLACPREARLRECFACGFETQKKSW